MLILEDNEALHNRIMIIHLFPFISFPRQIFNHFDKPVDIYTRDSTIVKKLGEVQPNESYVVPLHVAHTQELLAKPVDDRYDNGR